MTQIKRVLFIGSKKLGLRIWQEMHTLSPETLIGGLTIDDQNDVRSEFSAFQTFAQESKLPLHIAKNRRHAETLVQDLKPDLCFVVGWYWLISQEAITNVPFGFIGIHNSLLPQFRGGSPLIWPIIRGHKKAGFSMFSFTPGMDDGPIWVQGEVIIKVDDYISDILQKMEQKTLEVLRDTYINILNQTLQPYEQKHHLATYCAQRKPEDGNIDWSAPAEVVYNFIRAQSDPYPGVFTYLNGQKLTIWRAKSFDKPYIGTPGQIARISSEGVYVVCGQDTALILQEVELNGQRKAASKLVKSIRHRLSNNQSS